MKSGSVIGKIGNGILDLIYPPGLYCISCGKITDASRTYGLCNECMQSVRWVTGRSCCSCGRPLADNDPGDLCFSCAIRETAGDGFSFDKGHACTGYGAVEQSIIFAFKYGGRSDLGDILGEILYDRMKAEYGEAGLGCMYDLVIPVPTHKEKRSKRGFDHADLMAASFARRAGLRYDGGAVIRTRQTLPMKGLGPAERRANIKGAFEIRGSRLQMMQGIRVLLVDDIFTTGATIDEIAALLKDNGASRVDFAAFAAAADYLIV